MIGMGFHSVLPPFKHHLLCFAVHSWDVSLRVGLGSLAVVNPWVDLGSLAVVNPWVGLGSLAVVNPWVGLGSVGRLSSGG